MTGVTGVNSTAASMPEDLLGHARAAKGFMPEDEGELLHRTALEHLADGPALEIGSYCGKSAIYLGAAARARSSMTFTVDHHRGSEENQAGWFHHDTDVVDPATGKMDTLPFFRRAIHGAGVEPFVVGVVGQSPIVARYWTTSAAFVFIDGGHGEEPARLDYEGWARHVAVGGTLAIHDVFPDPADGGRPPYEQIFVPAVQSGRFKLASATGSALATSHASCTSVPR